MWTNASNISFAFLLLFFFGSNGGATLFALCVVNAFLSISSIFFFLGFALERRKWTDDCCLKIKSTKNKE